MKILKYKNDYNTAIVVNKNLTHIKGNIYYYITDELYNYYLLCRNNVGYPLSRNTHKTPQDLENAINEMQNHDTENIINMLKNAKENNKFISNLDLLFLKEIGEFELLEEFTTYKQELTARLTAEMEEKERQEKEKEEKEKEERERKQKEEREKTLASGYEKIKNQYYITAKEFELLCIDNNVKLPIKFLGWLREHCVEMQIKSRNNEELMQKYGYIPNFLYKYDVHYYYRKGHDSTTIDKYANELATAINL